MFEILARGDSLLMTSLVVHTVPTPNGDLPLEKNSFLVASMFDFGLRRYDSHQKFQERLLSRSVQVAETSLTIYRELDKAGHAEVIAAPPGRLFIIDPMMFTLFDLMCLSLQGRTFETRPLSVLVLGPATECSKRASPTSHGVDSLGRPDGPGRKLQIGATTDVDFIAGSTQKERCLVSINRSQDGASSASPRPPSRSARHDPPKPEADRG